MESLPKAKIKTSKAVLPWLKHLAVPVILVVCFAANYRSLFCFFFSDDLLCLDYLYKIFHGQPQLLLERLCSPWQDPSVSLLYRPLCDLCFFLDYAFWQNNAAGYHFSNLVLNAANSLLLFFVVLETNARLSSKRCYWSAFFSAVIFAAYPAHVEPVVWLVGRSDLLATFFILAALLLAAKLEKRQLLSSCLIAVLSAAAFLSKEAAASAPLLLCTYMFLIRGYKLSQVWKRIFPTLLALLLCVIWRQSILQTLVGGYTGSLGDELKSHFLQRILNWDLISLLGLASNLAVFKADSPGILALRFSFVILAAILFYRALKAPWQKPTLKLLAFWFLASLGAILPATPVLGISGVMTNARVFYLASAFYIPLILTALIPEETDDIREGRLLELATTFVCSLIAVAFIYNCNKSYGPWLEGSHLLEKFQASLHERASALKRGQRLTALFPYANYKGAHLLYEFNEARILLGKNFYSDNLSQKLMALDQFPDFYSASLTRLRRLLSHKDLYDVEVFDVIEKKLEPVSEAIEPFPLWEKTACSIEGVSISDSRDHAYWVSLGQTARLSDSSQVELIVNWRQAGAKRFCSCILAPPGQIPQEYQLAASVGEAKKCLRIYDIASVELRKIVAAKPAKLLYVQMPNEAELLSAYYVSGRTLASLEPDFSSMRELANGNYAPLAGECVLKLDVSAIPGAESMVLESAQPDYLFALGKVNVRTAQVYKRLAKAQRFQSKKSLLRIPVAGLEPGHDYAYRLIALNKDGKYIGFYSDTVCIDLRQHALK